MKARDLGLTAFVVVCLFGLCWPGLDMFGNGARPFVFGLPWIFAWHVGWILASFVALALYFVLDERGDRTKGGSQ